MLGLISLGMLAIVSFLGIALAFYSYFFWWISLIILGVPSSLLLMSFIGFALFQSPTIYLFLIIFSWILFASFIINGIYFIATNFASNNNWFSLKFILSISLAALILVILLGVGHSQNSPVQINSITIF
jgi:hypothetical protein